MGRSDTKGASKPPGLVAIGDVHGCAELLEAELQKHRGSGAELILLGDLIDRAPEPGGDRKVLETVMRSKKPPKPGGWPG